VSVFSGEVQRLERTAPMLVAARDKAVVELKREKLAAESSGGTELPASCRPCRLQ
jgi:hypothetical protein